MTSKTAVVVSSMTLCI